MSERFRAQVLLSGEPFYRPKTEIDLGGSNIDITIPRRVEIVAGVNDVGDNVFIAAKDLPEGAHVQDLPEVSVSSGGAIYDAAADGRRCLKTVRKRGASSTYRNVDDMVRARGGDSSAKILKPDDSFLFGKSPKQVEDE